MPAPPTTRSRSNRPEIRLPAQRRADGEEIDEIARQRIDRRPIDDRRLFRIAAEPAGIERHQQHDAGYRQQQAAEQSGPVQRPCAQIRHRRPVRQRQAYRRGSARSDKAAPARRSPAARTADRTTSACAVRARSRAQIRPPAAAGRSRRRSSAAKVRLRSTMRTTHCAGSGRSVARNAAAAAPTAGAPAPAGPNSTPGELNAATVIVSSTASTACCPPTMARASRYSVQNVATEQSCASR